jgi:glycosyltransferase involved in cell wall biosynthesis
MNPEPAPIRVLLIAPSLDIVGGQAVQAARLLPALKGVPGLAVDFQPLNPRLPGPLHWLQRVKYVRTLLTRLLYGTQLLRRVPRYDLLHVFSAGKTSYTLNTLPALLASRLYGKKIVINYRDGRAEEHLRRWRSARPTLRQAAAVVAPSEYLVEVFAAHGVAARAIPNIIDPAGFRYRPRRNLRPVLLTNRSLEPLYNVGCVLRAFARVQQRYPEASLTVAHDGVCRPALEQLARELGLRQVQFAGCVPPARIAELYDAADIYLMSPNVDCMPGTLLECFASGLPVVSTAVGGVPFMVRHEQTGLLAPAGDDAGLAACVLRLLEAPGLVERLTGNARRELDRYSAARVRAQWVALYRELLARR